MENAPHKAGETPALHGGRTASITLANRREIRADPYSDWAFHFDAVAWSSSSVSTRLEDLA